MSVGTGLIDDQVLEEMRREMVASFDTTVVWYKQVYDSNGHPASDLYGHKRWEDPVTLPARVTTDVQEVYTGLQVIMQRSVRITVEHHTGIQVGDVVLVNGQSFEDRAPIIGTAEVPSEERSVFEFVTIGVGI